MNPQDLPREIAALSHESLDNSMERAALELLLAKGLEVLHCARHDRVEQLYCKSAGSRSADGYVEVNERHVQLDSGKLVDWVIFDGLIYDNALLYLL
jgi:hypothetical protein